MSSNFPFWSENVITFLSTHLDGLDSSVQICQQLLATTFGYIIIESIKKKKIKRKEKQSSIFENIG
jgi:positive regulator of sigma E activity